MRITHFVVGAILTWSLLGCEGDPVSEAAPAAMHDEPSAEAVGSAENLASSSQPAAETEPPMPDANTEGAAEQAAVEIDLRNRLGDETSPYLLQHQHNPVHWYPWGEEAFEAARALDRPIFLSIGYSTCYWCHVMERESFENEEIAAMMNERFVCIKVDREERPDVDAIYMAATQYLNQGHGGWPMSVFLEPKTLKPFLAGTYFPPEDRQGGPGFPSVMRQVEQYWINQREAVLGQADAVAAQVVRQLSLPSQPQSMTKAHVERAAAQLLSQYDRTYGGFRQGSPKFPTPSNPDFIIATAWEHKPYHDAVLHTLDAMAMGGMYDQIGGGFHRYSTDPKWLVPHFEKMLYDNGLLASTYARAYELSDDPYYAEIVRETLDYVIREMTDPAGGFWSAQDAEVHAREGLSYIWVREEVEQALTDAGLADDIPFALQAYGLDAGTNFRDPHHPEDGYKNVIFLVAKPADLAVRMGMPLDEFNERLVRVNAELLQVRDQREQPGTDDKVLTGWNGLMIGGMSDGGRVLGESRYVDAARTAAEFILTTMRAPDGSLLRTYRDGNAKISGFLEDHAYMVHGLLRLHEATGEKRWLTEAERLAAEAHERFWDDHGGAYFDTLEGQSDLFVRGKSFYDGAVPSGNAVMLNNLVTLHERTGRTDYLDQAKATLDTLSTVLAQSPAISTVAMIALYRMIELDPDHFGAQFAVSPGENPVRISVSESIVSVSEGGVAEFEVTLRVAQGHHVNAHKPGIEYLIPLELSLVGAENVRLEVEYPRGEVYDGPEKGMIVHHGKVTLPVRLVATGPVSGRASLMVRYQVCNDKVCLQPQNEPVPVRIQLQ